MAFGVCSSLEQFEERRFSFHPMKINGCEPPLHVRLDSYPPARGRAGGIVDNRIPVKRGGGGGRSKSFNVGLGKAVSGTPLIR